MIFLNKNTGLIEKVNNEFVKEQYLLFSDIYEKVEKSKEKKNKETKKVEENKEKPRE